MPKKRTKTIATLSVRIGGCIDAIVISQALDIVNPIPPIKAKAPNE
jgi:hypothetical protein